MRGSGQVDAALDTARAFAAEAAATLAQVADTEAGAALVAASDHLLETVQAAAAR